MVEKRIRRISCSQLVFALKLMISIMILLKNMIINSTIYSYRTHDKECSYCINVHGQFIICDKHENEAKAETVNISKCAHIE